MAAGAVATSGCTSYLARCLPNGNKHEALKKLFISDNHWNLCKTRG